MTETKPEGMQTPSAGHNSSVSHRTPPRDASTSSPEVAISTILGALAMEPTREKAEANLLNLLIVDDERSIREGCRDVAQGIGYSTYVADNAEHAFRVLDTTCVDVVLLDLRLPGVGGLEVLKEVKRRRPETVVIVMTGYASVQSAVQAMKQGAYDYVTKPFNLEELRLILDRVLGHLQLSSENRILRQQVKSKEGFGAIIGRSPEMENLYRIISKAAHSSHPVLILGESGTGKELVARSIHFSGPYRDKPFVAVDCGSLVPSLIESELFGYVKGAFTGAVKNKDGLLQAADGGTIFLDEDRRAAYRSAVQAAAGAAGERGPSGGRHQGSAGGCPGAGGHQPRPGTRGIARHLPQGSVLPAERADPAHSSAAQPQAGHSAAGGALPGAAGALHRSAAQHQRRRAEADAGLRLAGQHPRAGELHRTRLRADQRTRRFTSPTCPPPSRTGASRASRWPRS